MSDERDHIVCATDFSPASEHALAWAVALARRSRAAAELASVLPAASEDLADMATDVRVMESAAWRAARQRLEQKAQAIGAVSGVPVRTHVLDGEPAAAIAGLAAELRAQLIVVGAHNRSTIGRWMLGSVAERTVRAARVPVALVPPEAEVGPEAAGRPPDGQRPWRVMAAIDLGAGARRVTEFVAGFRRRLACDVTFVHLYWPQEQIARLGLQGARDLLAPDPDVVDNLEPALRASLGPLAADPQVNLSVRPAWGEPAANLLLAAQEQDADLVVVGPEERHGLARVMHPAVATSLARRARYVPVVCLPPIRDREASPAAAPIPLLSTVLAPTDLSPAGNRAALHAYGLLRGRGGVVELCHIHEHPVPNPPYAYDDLRARLSPQRRAALEGELRALIPPDAERLGIATHVSIVEGGEAATAIGQAAARLNVDVICMGSHGRSGLGRALLGSVTAEVARHAGKPLLIVH